MESCQTMVMSDSHLLRWFGAITAVFCHVIQHGLTTGPLVQIGNANKKNQLSCHFFGHAQYMYFASYFFLRQIQFIP